MDDSFQKVKELVSEHAEIEKKVYQKYEKGYQIFFAILWAGVSFLFLKFTFIGAAASFVLMCIYFIFPRVTESKKVEKFFYRYFWKKRFERKVSIQKGLIVFQLFELKDFVLKMKYYDEWAPIASQARKIMGI